MKTKAFLFLKLDTDSRPVDSRIMSDPFPTCLGNFSWVAVDKAEGPNYAEAREMLVSRNQQMRSELGLLTT